jgi:SSS family solute:Na+ symporter
MDRNLVFADYLVFILYFLLVSSYGYWVYRRKKKAVTDTKDFFLAEGSLTWWAIGASLIASNISAEQFIGMSGEDRCDSTDHHRGVVHSHLPEE